MIRIRNRWVIGKGPLVAIGKTPEECVKKAEALGLIKGPIILWQRPEGAA